MARARNIKPGFFKNEELAECSLAARLCFPGLWLLADREGRLEDRPKRIKGELFPFDTFEVGPLLDELHARGFIVRYRNEAGSFIQISKFLEHQNPHYSEKPSVIKPPTLPESEASKPAPLPDDGGDDGGGDSGRTPGKDPSSRGGRNPLNPESLNPDSGILNPERTVGATPTPPARDLQGGAEDPDPPSPEDPPEPPPDPLPPPSAAGLACRAMRRAGMTATNPSDPRLHALLEAGVTADELAAIAAEAVDKGKGNAWSWVLAVAKARRDEAAEIAAATGAVPIDPMAWRKSLDGVQRRAGELGLSPKPGEMAHDFERRVLTAHQRAAGRQGAAA